MPDYIFVPGKEIAKIIQKQMLKSYEVKKEVEYRFIPRNIYDEQLGSPQVSKSFVNNNMDIDVLKKFLDEEI